MPISALDAFDPRNFDGQDASIGHAAGAQTPAKKGRSLGERVKAIVDKVNEIKDAVNGLPLTSTVLATSTELTIATGAITITQNFHRVDTEADAASDDLDSIAGGNVGELLLLRAEHDARTVVLKNSATLITPSGRDISLAEDDDYALLIRHSVTAWMVIAFKTLANGGGGLGSALASVANGLGASLIGIEDAGGHIVAATVEAALAELAQETQAIVAENTDVEIAVPIFGGFAEAGTYTRAITSGGVRTLTRTAAAGIDGWWMEAPLRSRTTASRGVKVSALRVAWSVGTATVDDVRIEVYKRTIPADQSAPGAPTLLGGDNNAHYDTPNNTAAKRSSHTTGSGNHTALMTLPSPAYLATNEELLVRFMVDGDAGPSGVVVLKDLVLLASETLVELS